MSGSHHFSLEDRIVILQGIMNHSSIRAIASKLNASPSSVSRELKLHRFLTPPSFVMHNPPSCPRVLKAPWICDGCAHLTHCSHRKFRYSPRNSQLDYEKLLHDCRRKVRTGSAGFDHINQIITPLVRDQKQTMGHIYATHAEELGISRSTCYRYIGQNLLQVHNSDLPMRVRYPKNTRKSPRGDNSGIDHLKCRENRDYAAFQAHIARDPHARIAELDSVIGRNGSGQNVLLTILFRKSHFMIAFLRQRNTAASVIECLDWIQHRIGYASFKTLFNVSLTDNGPEFKDALRIERGRYGAQRCHLFYCDSRASQQKGRLEKNHEYIRKYFPQGTSFNSLSQDDVNRMMSHINSVKRDSLGGRSPFDLLSRAERKDMEKLGIRPIPADEVLLSPKLFIK